MSVPIDNIFSWFKPTHISFIAYFPDKSKIPSNDELITQLQLNMVDNTSNFISNVVIKNFNYSYNIPNTDLYFYNFKLKTGNDSSNYSLGKYTLNVSGFPQLLTIPNQNNIPTFSIQGIQYA